MRTAETAGPAPRPRVAVVDDDRYLLLALKQTLELSGCEVDVFDKPLEALARVAGGGYQAFVADVKMPRVGGLELLGKVRELAPDLPVILITGHGDVPLAVAALKQGAYDFLEKPVDDGVLLASLRRAVEKTRLLESNRRLSSLLGGDGSGRSRFQGLVGSSAGMQSLYRTIETVAAEDFPVLITGETGTGKELVARAIHAVSPRSRERFVALNMGAIPEQMLESELFGYEAGAFTGATRRIAGKFEHAGGGTIFLDEISSMPLALQVKILRVLEERAVLRLGSNVPVPVRARIIAASNRDLRLEVERGSFRADLFFRLDVIPLQLPPLRERAGDIPLLVDHFVSQFNAGRRDRARPLPGPTLRWMMEHPWPGNVRELENCVKKACLLAEHAPGAGTGAEPTAPAPAGEASLKAFLAGAERDHLARALRRNGGRVIPASRALGISRKTLYEKMKRHGLDKRSFRGDPGEPP